MDSPLTVTLRTLNGNHAEIEAVGEVDVSSQAQLRDQLVDAVGKGALDLVVDLGGVTFLDSSGLRGMIEAIQLGAALTLRHLRPAVQHVFDVVDIPGITIEK
jgi:anti-anti-sigma factor